MRQRYISVVIYHFALGHLGNFRRHCLASKLDIMLESVGNADGSSSVSANLIESYTSTQLRNSFVRLSQFDAASIGIACPQCYLTRLRSPCASSNTNLSYDLLCAGYSSIGHLLCQKT